MPDFPASPIFCIVGRLSMVRCRGGARPSRRCTGGKCGPMLKRQWPPSLSLRGAKRRGALSAQREEVPLGCNLAGPGWITGHSRRKRNCLPEIATAPLGPRNDKLDGIAAMNWCHNHCPPVWRSMSAATDAIGACLFNGSRYESSALRRAGHAPPLQGAH